MMKHKEDIGVLIYEKLNQVQKSPSDDLWNKINTTLDEKKKKRRGFFIWFTAIGLLALLLILYFGTRIFNSSETIDTKNEIVNRKPSDSNSKDYKSENHIENNQTVFENSEVETNETEEITITDESSSNNYSNKNSNKKNVNKQVDNLNTENNIQNTTSNKLKKSKNNTSDNKVKTVSNNNSTKKHFNDYNNNTIDSKKNTLEKSINSETISDKNKTGNNSNDSVSEKSSDVNNTPETALEKRLSERQQRKDSITKLREERKDSIAELRKPKEENIEKTEEAEKKDSISGIENQKMKFNITLIAAPQYSTVTNSGSMINRQLEGLDTKGAFNFNYGASLNFIGVKRMFSIGVLRTKISYQTLNTSILDPFYQNIGEEMVLIYPESILDFGTLDKDASVSNSILEDFKNDDNTINLVQKIEYIEVPLRYTYFLSDKRFGLQVYGGISGYFLSDNSLIAENNSGEKLTVGKVNNLSDISLSLNAGAGIYYNISKIFTAELNPTFKFLYKPTTTESTKGSVLLFGIYTGIRMNLFSNNK